jgi:hypothetical protein
MDIIRFIWDANPSYDVYREFSKRHLFVGYKVHELISARLKIEKRKEHCAPIDRYAEDSRKGGFLIRLCKQVACTRPVKAAYQIVCAREIVCPLICKLMSKRHDGHSAFGSGATAAMDYG